MGRRITSWLASVDQKGLWIGTLVTCVVLVAGSILAFGVTLGGDDVEDCTVKTEADPGPLGPSQERAKVEPESDVLNMSFGRDRGAMTEDFFFGLSEVSPQALPPPPEHIAVRKRPLVRQELEGQIPSDQYHAEMRVTGRSEVRMSVCVDPGAIGAHPGTYTGIVTSDDPRIEDVTVPITMTLQYSQWNRVAVPLGVAVLMFGSFFVWASTVRSKGDDVLELMQVGTFVPWFWRNLFGLGVGAVAATSVFAAQYLRDPSWGADAPFDWFTLLGAMFTAFTAGLTATRSSP
ncbi:MAG: hypothetical protein ACRDJ5_11245, partial [Actinomycetota bacterium]